MSAVLETHDRLLGFVLCEKAHSGNIFCVCPSCGKQLVVTRPSPEMFPGLFEVTLTCPSGDFQFIQRIDR